MFNYPMYFNLLCVFIFMSLNVWQKASEQSVQITHKHTGGQIILISHERNIITSSILHMYIYF